MLYHVVCIVYHVYTGHDGVLVYIVLGLLLCKVLCVHKRFMYVYVLCISVC